MTKSLITPVKSLIIMMILNCHQITQINMLEDKVRTMLLNSINNTWQQLVVMKIIADSRTWESISKVYLTSSKCLCSKIKQRMDTRQTDKGLIKTKAQDHMRPCTIKTILFSNKIKMTSWTSRLMSTSSNRGTKNNNKNNNLTSKMQLTAKKKTPNKPIRVAETRHQNLLHRNPLRSLTYSR